MPETTLEEALAELSEQIEKILHVTLPEAARREVESDEPGSSGLARVVEELDHLQKALGLKTYELLRGRALSPVLRRLAPRGIPSSPTAPGPDLVGDAELPDPEDYDPGEKGAPATVACYRCRSTVNVTSCPDCAKPFCPEHVDPAMHPCGDLL